MDKQILFFVRYWNTGTRLIFFCLTGLVCHHLKIRLYELLIQAKKAGWKNVTNQELELQASMKGEATLVSLGLRSQITPINIFLTMIDDDVIGHLLEQAAMNINNCTHEGRGRRALVSKNDILKLVAWYVRVCGEQWPSLEHAWNTCSEVPLTQRVYERIRKWISFDPVELFGRFNSALKRVMKVEQCYVSQLLSVSNDTYLGRETNFSL